MLLMLMLNKVLLALLILFLEGFCESQGSALIHLTLHDFKNPDNIKHDGSICDTNTLGDNCDHVFYICLSRITECDIDNRTITKIYNTQMIFSMEFPFERIPSKFDVKVIARDAEDDGSHELIGVFRYTFLNMVPKNKYIRELSLKNMEVTLVVDLSIKCSTNYYGPFCTEYCKREMGIYRCDDKTGNKVCLLECPEYKQCGINPQYSNDRSEQYYICVCKSGYGGQDCRTKIKTITKLTTTAQTTLTSSLTSITAKTTRKLFTTGKISKLIRIKQAVSTTSSQNSKSSLFRVNSTESIATDSESIYSKYSVQPYFYKTLYPNNKDNFIKNFSISYNLYTISIISLSVLLCFFMLIMMLMIQKCNAKKNKRKNFSIPPVNDYEKITTIPNETRDPDVPTCSAQIYKFSEPADNNYDENTVYEQIEEDQDSVYDKIIFYEQPLTQNSNVYMYANNPVQNREASCEYRSIKEKR